MRIRTRLTVAAAVAVACSIAMVAAIVFFAERRDLLDQVDTDLARRASAVADELLVSGEVDDVLRPPFGEAVAYAQVISADGDVVALAPGSPDLPAGERSRAVAAGRADRFYDDVEVDDVELRLLTVPLSPGRALQLARPVDELGIHLLHLGGILLLVTLAGIGLAVLVGRLVARTSLAPVRRLTADAEHVAATRDLSSRIHAHGDDELARLATSVNTMLEALDTAVRAQRQLVADASHELHTPLTSLRTNVDVLCRSSDPSDAERRRLLADVTTDVESLVTIVGDLVDLARDAPVADEREEVALDVLIQACVCDARRHFPNRTFTCRLDPLVLVADRARLARAVSNLLDNAAQWTVPGTPIEITLGDGRLVVRDHGPGIDADDLPHVFERFYRSPAARAAPGSGLGLAIVGKVVDDHGWEVTAENDPGGGARFTVKLPRQFCADS